MRCSKLARAAVQSINSKCSQHSQVAWHNIPSSFSNAASLTPESDMRSCSIKSVRAAAVAGLGGPRRLGSSLLSMSAQPWHPARPAQNTRTLWPSATTCKQATQAGNNTAIKCLTALSVHQRSCAMCALRSVRGCALAQHSSALVGDRVPPSMQTSPRTCSSTDVRTSVTSASRLSLSSLPASSTSVRCSCRMHSDSDPARNT